MLLRPVLRSTGGRGEARRRRAVVDAPARLHVATHAGRGAARAGVRGCVGTSPDVQRRGEKGRRRVRRRSHRVNLRTRHAHGTKQRTDQKRQDGQGARRRTATGNRGETFERPRGQVRGGAKRNSVQRVRPRSPIFHAINP